MSIVNTCITLNNFSNSDIFMTIGARIKQARLIKNVTRAHLARVILIAPQSLYEIETNQTKQPRLETIERLSKALGVSSEFLMLGKGSLDSPVEEAYFVPVISLPDVIKWPSCDFKDTEKISMYAHGLQNCYAVKVPNDLMSPRFNEGDLIFINPGREPKDGDFVIAYEKGALESMLKKYTVDGADKYLYSLKSPGPNPIKVNDNIEIKGVVVRRRVPDDIIA